MWPHAAALLPGNKTYFYENDFFEQSDEKIWRCGRKIRGERQKDRERERDKEIKENNKTAADEQNANDGLKYENSLKRTFKMFVLKTHYSDRGTG